MLSNTPLSGARTTPLLLVLAALSPLGCLGLHQAGPLEIAEPVPRDAGERWEEVVRQHTRKVEVYEWAVRQVDLRATLVTPRLRTAFIAADARLHGSVAHDVEDDLLRLGARPDEGVDAPMLSGPGAEEQVIVYVCFYVADQSNRDLAASYTIWDTHLARGDARVKPLAIEPMKHSPALAALLPHADRFDEIYAVRFPLIDARTGTSMMAPGSEPLRLEIQSALGDAIVSWTPVAE